MRALFFDFDGLILDTETPEFRVWSEIFAEHGVAMPDGYWAGLIGRGAEQEYEAPHALLERLVGAPVLDEAGHRERRRRILAHIDEQEIRPGVRELLDEAIAAGLPVAVVSSSRHAWVDGHLARLGLFGRFVATICADDVARAKPFPDLYLRACAELGVAPGEAIALEDSPNGVAAARAAGVFVVAVPNRVTASLDLSAADGLVPSLEGVGLADLARLHDASPARPRVITRN